MRLTWDTVVAFHLVADWRLPVIEGHGCCRGDASEGATHIALFAGFDRIRIESLLWPRAYRSPVLSWTATLKGTMVSLSAAEYNLEGYPCAKRVEMAGRSHGLGLYSEPGPVVAEIRRFFDGLPNSNLIQDFW